MAELGATVAGLLSLTITVIEISHRYFSNAKNATRTIRGYFRELEALKLLLDDFKNIQTQGFSTATTTALQGCHSELEQLRSKLQKRSSETAFSKAVHRLTWPFAEEETRRLIEVIHRYLDVFTAALSVDNIKLTTTTLETMTRNESRAIYMERRRVLSSLSMVNPYSNHTAARDKHGTSTGDWLLVSGAFVMWQQDKHSSLWLNGIPGAGKTILCSTAIDFLQKNRDVNEAVLIWYFDFSDDQKQLLDALLRSLLAQACELLDQIPPEVMDLFVTDKEHTRHPSLDRKTLLDLMKTVFASFDNVMIVVDALDESSEVSSVLGFLHDLKGTAFENVKWLVTSRQKQEIGESLLGIQTGVVSLDNTFVDADIRCFISQCLTRDPKLSSKPARIKQQIEDTLTEKAHGMFRWVECQLEVIRRCRTAPAIEAALRTLPETLDATYERILQAIDAEDREHAYRALELLAFSKRPLRVEEAAEAIVIVPGCKSFDPDDRFFDPKDVLSICAGLVKRVQDGNDLVLAHYSVQEFLLSHRIRQSTVAFFGLDHKMSQINIAEACLTYLLSFEGISAFDSGIEYDYPFLEYAAIHWLEHVELGTMDSPSILTSLIFNLMRRWQGADEYLDWSRFLDPDLLYDYTEESWGNRLLKDPENGSRTSAVALMCLLQRLDIALSLLEAEDSLHFQADDYGIVLRYAIRGSNVALFDRVIAARRGLDLPLLHGYSDLCVAAKKGDPRMVTKLLDFVEHTHGLISLGSNRSLSDIGIVTEIPLLVAARYHHPNTMKVLLEAGADVNAVAGFDGSILSAVLGDNFLPPLLMLEMVKLLIDFGADVNACRNCTNPLSTFLSRLLPPRRMTPKVAQILCAHGIELAIPFGKTDIMLYNLASTIESNEWKTTSVNPSNVADSDSNHTLSSVELEEPSVFETLAVVNLLLSTGADPNARGRLYPQCVRAESSNYSDWWEKFKILLEAGANLDLLGPDRGTALQAACCLPFESPDTVTALLKAGADPNLYDVEAESPLNMAIKREYKTIIKILEEAGTTCSILQEPKEDEQVESEADDFDVDVTKVEGTESTVQP